MNSNLRFELVSYKSGRGGHLYSVKFEDRSDTELNLFLNDPIVQAEKDIEDFQGRLVPMVECTGFEDYFFDHRESSSDIPVCRLKHGRTRLRLYFLYCGKGIIIAGGGGVKPRGIRRYQDDPVLKDAVCRLEYVNSRMKEAEEFEELKITQFGEELRFTGKIAFERE